MIKWLFGALVLANLGLLMWGAWYREPLVATSASQPEPDIAPNKVPLLSEPGVRLIPRQRAATTEAPSSTCYRLGPFLNPESARMAGEVLDGWGLAFERVQELETRGVAYRLSLAPMASREAADAKRRELSQLGFLDHAVLQEEDSAGYIVALGVFAVEQNARVRQQQLVSKGVKASIQTIPKLRPLFWLVLKTPIVNERAGDVPLSRLAGNDWGSAEVSLRRDVCSSGGGDSSGPS